MTQDESEGCGLLTLGAVMSLQGRRQWTGSTVKLPVTPSRPGNRPGPSRRSPLTGRLAVTGRVIIMMARPLAGPARLGGPWLGLRGGLRVSLPDRLRVGVGRRRRPGLPAGLFNKLPRILCKCKN